MPSIGTLTLTVSNFMTLHPALVNEVANHALSHVFYSYARKACRGSVDGPSLSRRQSRKSSNRKRRWFVDNIIMHHKRLHDRNRENIINGARARALAKREALKKQSPSKLPTSLKKDQNDSQRWRNMAKIKDRGVEIRGRVDARMLRARSRWMSVVESSS